MSVCGILLTLQTPTRGQIFEVRVLEEKSPFDSAAVYSFPYISREADNGIADSINRSLAKEVLDITLGEQRASIFENVWGSKQRPTPRLYDLSFDILRNDGILLSVAISAEGCGAYCEYFTRYLNFDSRTGRRVYLTELLTEQGLRLLLDSLIVRQRREIEDFVQQTKESLRGRTLSDEDQDYYDDMFSMYEVCLERSDSIATDFADYLEFMLNDDTISVLLDDCSVHMNRNVDELGEFEFEFDLIQWSGVLSEFGQMFLLN